ncbi:MAG: glutathione synthase [bacterium]|nr:glutathione synthase [bacterium]MBU1917716.1 glutathione synthase [bacterium]
MHICFVINPWEKMNPETESTLRIIHEAAIRGHRIALLYSRNLAVRDNITYGLCKILERKDKYSDHVSTFFKKATFKSERLPLKGFDVIFLRKEPPLDNIMLNFLDSVKDDTFIVNDIDGLRKAASKLYLTTFEDSNEYIPETHVSKDKDYLFSVIDNSDNEKWILKPLDGYGGKGIIVLEKRAKENITSLLDFYTDGPDRKNYVILQECVEGAELGDVRVMMLNGEPIGAMKRVPSENEIRSNVHAGGTPVKHILTKQERLICNFIGPQLVSDGIFFAGIDIISNKLIEINVMSPGGIVNINRLNKTKLQKPILDFLERKFKQKEKAHERKRAYRKAVEDA